MDFAEELRTRAARFITRVNAVDTEEATKTSMVMPFIQTLGYNPFDPTEVVPEFTADVGVKKGEKVDYAIMQDGEPIILIECKKTGTDLDNQELITQLMRYFGVTNARFGVLTDGMKYRFYSDLDDTNRMDSRPFFECDMASISDEDVEQLRRFTKDAFKVEDTIEVARDLKYGREIKRILAEELERPSDEMVRLFASRVRPGRMTKVVKDQFTDLTGRALRNFVTDRIKETLTSALTKEGQPPAPIETAVAEDQDIQRPTEDERQALYIVKAILAEAVDVKRVYLREAKDYSTVILDDNNRKPVCRLRFLTSRKAVMLIDADKNEQRVDIQELDDIYSHAGRLRETAERYPE